MSTALQLHKALHNFTSGSCHNIQRYSENDKHFPKTERGGGGAGEEKDQDCEPSLLLSIRIQYNTGYQYTMILPGLHSCMHTGARAHTRTCCGVITVDALVVRWCVFVCVMCQRVWTEGSPVREVVRSHASLHTKKTHSCAVALLVFNSSEVMVVMTTPWAGGVPQKTERKKADSSTKMQIHTILKLRPLRNHGLSSCSAWIKTWRKNKTTVCHVVMPPALALLRLDLSSSVKASI